MMKIKVIDVKCDVSEIEIDVKDELSDLGSQGDKYKRRYDGNFKVIENTEEVNDNAPQSHEKSEKCEKCESSKVDVEMNYSKAYEYVRKVNETDEICNNNKLVMKIPESYVKIKKNDIQEVAFSFEHKLNNNQAASKAVKSRSTTSSLSTVSLLAYPRSEVQAPLTAFFLPTASSVQTDGPVDSAEPALSHTCSGSRSLYQVN